MAATRLISYEEASPEVRQVFDDIRRTRKTDFINNMWLALANDPELLRRTWAEVKAIMGQESAIDPLTKEMIYIAVSATNGCGYCVHSHTAAARAKGMTEKQHGELLAIVALAAKTNQLASAMAVPVDAAFDRQ
jgi:AhpD family alkylhydroperoxidase